MISYKSGNYELQDKRKIYQLYLSGDKRGIMQYNLQTYIIKELKLDIFNNPAFGLQILSDVRQNYWRETYNFITLDELLKILGGIPADGFLQTRFIYEIQKRLYAIFDKYHIEYQPVIHKDQYFDKQHFVRSINYEICRQNQKQVERLKYIENQKQYIQTFFKNNDDLIPFFQYQIKSDENIQSNRKYIQTHMKIISEQRNVLNKTKRLQKIEYSKMNENIKNLKNQMECNQSQ